MTWNVLFQKSLPAQMDSLPVLRDSLLNSARTEGLDERKIMKLDMALEEVLVNIVHYSYTDSEEVGEIMICGGLDKERDPPMFIVEVIDGGKPFDVTVEAAYPDISANIDERKIGGLGIYLVKRMMDFIEYERKDGKNMLRFGIQGGANLDREEKL